MRILWLAAFLGVLTITLVPAADWPAPGGNPQHNGWARTEQFINKTSISTLQLLYKYKADNESRALRSLTPPIINGNLITYLGFKEMLMFGGSSDKVYSVDADLNKIIWESRLPFRAANRQHHTPTLACPGGLTAPVIMAGNSASSINFAAARRAPPPPAPPGTIPRRPSPYLPPLAESVYPLTPTTLTRLAAVYAVSSDGNLHVLNSSTGEDLIPSMPFVPANSNVTSLNLRDNVVYSTTAGGCNGTPNAVYAIDLLSPDKKVTSFVAQGGGDFAGTGGTSIGNDGTIYVETVSAPGEAAGEYHDTVVALTPKELQVKDYFVVPGKALGKKDILAPGITPLVFSGSGKDLILAAGRNGRLYILDSTSLGGADHHTPLSETPVFARSDRSYEGNGFRGTFSSWLDVDSGTRWFYAPLVGPAPALEHLGAAASNSHPAARAVSTGGRVLGLKLTEQNGCPTLEPVWVSRDMTLPSPVVITNAMAFVLSTGEPVRLRKKSGGPYTPAEFERLSTHATLYAFDAATGKELYSSGTAITATSSAEGFAIANGRIYIPAHDNSVYCFGFRKGQTQLTEQ